MTTVETVMLWAFVVVMVWVVVLMGINTYRACKADKASAEKYRKKIEALRRDEDDNDWRT